MRLVFCSFSLFKPLLSKDFLQVPKLPFVPLATAIVRPSSCSSSRLELGPDPSCPSGTAAAVVAHNGKEKKPSSLWKWKPLKALSHIGHHRSNNNFQRFYMKVKKIINSLKHTFDWVKKISSRALP